MSSPQKEADGTKDAYVSYLVTTEVLLFDGWFGRRVLIVDDAAYFSKQIFESETEIH